MYHSKLKPYQDLLDEILASPPEEGPSRVTTLEQAIGEHLKPGMRVHTLVTHAFPYGLINQLVRNFWKKDPGFTLVSLAAVNQAVIMLRGGMLKKIITSYCGDVYPAPGPNPNFNQVYLDKTVQIENWTVLSLTARLLAAAMGISGMPIRSLEGTSMAEENRDSYTSISPFGLQPQGFVRSLAPDISLVHGWVADPAGNVLFCPPLSENLWGAMAARQGALVSVERLVPTSFIRENSHLAKLPARFVKAVVELPFGAHPGGFFGRPLPTGRSYAEDYDFIVQFRNTNRDPDKLDQWVRHWILECKDHQEYLQRLGPSRLTDLIQKGRPDAWQDDLAGLADGLNRDPTPAPLEIMAAEAARRIAESCRRQGHQFILAGQGVSNLAACLAAYALRREGHPVDLVSEVGMAGYTPRPGNPFLFNFANIPHCKMLSDSLVSLGALAGGSDSKCIGSLGAGQVDRSGSINSTKVPGVFYIVGSGGAGDVLRTAAEVILTVPLDPLRFVDRLPYVTGTGERVTTLVCERGVLVKPRGSDELILQSVVPDGDKTKVDIAQEIKERVGWELKVAQKLAWVALPETAQIKTLRLLDPRGSFLKNDG